MSHQTSTGRSGANKVKDFFNNWIGVIFDTCTFCAAMSLTVFLLYVFITATPQLDIDGTWTQASNISETNYNIVEFENNSAVFYKFYPEYGAYEYIDFGSCETINNKVIVNDKVVVFNDDLTKMTYDGFTFVKKP